jgi:hypothetical protein
MLKSFLKQISYAAIDVWYSVLDSLDDVRNDYLLHMFYGFLMAIPLVFIFGWVGIVFVFFIAALKEVLDFIRSTQFKAEFNYKNSVIDIVFTVAPSIIVWAI